MLMTKIKQVLFKKTRKSLSGFLKSVFFRVSVTSFGGLKVINYIVFIPGKPKKLFPVRKILRSADAYVICVVLQENKLSLKVPKIDNFLQVALSEQETIHPFQTPKKNFLCLHACFFIPSSLFCGYPRLFDPPFASYFESETASYSYEGLVAAAMYTTATVLSILYHCNMPLTLITPAFVNYLPRYSYHLL